MAEDRKARLKALAAKAGRTKEVPAEEPAEEKKALTFRNYAPTDKTLDAASTGADNDDGNEPQAKKARVVEDSKPAAAPTSKSMMQDALAETKRSTAIPSRTAATADVTTMAPKKINWDLKRDIQPKLDKLERRTQKAIVEMLKERLELEAAKEMDDDDDSDDNLD